MQNTQGEFLDFLFQEGKSENTIKTYALNIAKYQEWFGNTYGMSFSKLHRQNILEYKSYLVNVKKHKGKHLNAKTVNGRLSAMHAYNKFLISCGIQDDIVIDKRDFIKVQLNYANPCTITKIDVEQFRQRILESGDKRLYALATLLAYGGLRISEALAIKISDYSLEARELTVRMGKGGKQRVVYLNSRIVSAFQEFVKERKSDSEYLFASRESPRVNRTVINKKFKVYSKEITPHMLRHFYASHCLEMGYAIHELAYQAGHRDVKTTLLYTNPSRDEMKRKAELL